MQGLPIRPVFPGLDQVAKGLTLAHLALLNFTFYFLLFIFYYMSNVYTTLLNNYITANLRGKKVN